MISLKLLSEVLGFNVKEIKKLDDIRILHTDFNGWIILCEDSNNDFLITSMSELSLKCKEWAFNEGYSICSFKDEEDDTLSYWSAYISRTYMIFNLKKIIPYIQTTEHECIFKACEYILSIK